MAEPPSSPPSGDASAEDTLSWYKAQYEQLEHELIEFRESSRELEAELEKDLDAADKRERTLREKAEALDYEVDEWKRKYKDSKAEGNAAQNNLEKEITKLRDANRTLQLRLRDIEVANDDFERQARNTTSSLEDLESKYNVAIERGVLLEEEIKMGELERETLRVDAQRLREELSDLRIEADILQDKLRKHDARLLHLSAISTDTTSVLSVPESPTFDRSPNSTASSPLITTPPDTKTLPVIADDDDDVDNEAGTALADLQEPPSPPMSDASAPRRKRAPTLALARTPIPSSRRTRLPSSDPHSNSKNNTTTPRPKTTTATFSSSGSSRTQGTRIIATAATRTPGPRLSSSSSSSNKNNNNNSTATAGKPAKPLSTRSGATAHRLPSSNSLSHIRSLTAQMQRLEARVHSVRSKLPAPVTTPPRASPRTSALGGPGMVPSSVTIRSRKRTIGSAASSVAGSSIGFGDDSTPTASGFARPVGGGGGGGGSSTTAKHVPRLSTSGVSRLSFGPLPNRDHAATGSTTTTTNTTESRPSSRASVSSYARPASRNDARDMPPPRPMSRASLSGARTPLGRPRSSLGGNINTASSSITSSMHGHSMSIGGLPEDEVDTSEYRTPSRRGTYSKYEMEHALLMGGGGGGGGGSNGLPAPVSGIPLPGGGGNRRQSGGSTAGSATGLPLPSGRRTSMSTK